MIIVKLDLLDGCGLIEVVVKDIVVAERLRKFSHDTDKAFCDAERWIKVSKLMTHERAGPHVGWTLGMVMPGDDPDQAIDDWSAK